MAFLLVYLGILAYLCQNTSRDNGLLNSYKDSTFVTVQYTHSHLNFTIKISMGKVNPVFLFSNLLQSIPLLYIYN